MSDSRSKDLTASVSRKEFNKATKRIDYLLTGVTLVLAVGFVTLLITVYGLVADARREESAFYKQLVQQVMIQNEKIDFLYQQSFIPKY